MYHGAHLVLVWLKQSSYASIYLSQSSRFFASAGENFQFFSGSSIRARNRSLCSSFDKFRKILSTTMPFSDKYFSKLLICSKRRCQILRSLTEGGSCCFSKY